MDRSVRASYACALAFGAATLNCERWSVDTRGRFMLSFVVHVSPRLPQSSSGDAVFANNTFASMGDLGSKVLPQAPSSTVWTAGEAVEVSWGIRFSECAVRYGVGACLGVAMAKSAVQLNVVRTRVLTGVLLCQLSSWY